MAIHSSCVSYKHADSCLVALNRDPLKTHFTLFAVMLLTQLACAGPSMWPDIKVEVQADQPVETAQTVTDEADGFQRLAITLANKGSKPLAIERINVRIPVAEKLTSGLEALYGGSCMGRTPMLRQNVGAATAKSCLLYTSDAADE